MLRWLDELPVEFRKLEAQPDSARWLKRGNTATVARLGFGSMELVVKRYNNKSLWHRLRRALRRDRGLNSWVYSHTLRFTGLPTARCVALLRTRWMGPTYLVMEAITGAELRAEHLEGDEHVVSRSWYNLSTRSALKASCITTPKPVIFYSAG